MTDSSGAVVGPSNGKDITDEAGRIVIDDLEPGTHCHRPGDQNAGGLRPGWRPEVD